MDFQNDQAPRSIPRRIIIASLMTMSTGTYGSMYSRPYVTSITGNNSDLLDVIEERVNRAGDAQVTASTFNGLGNQILQPSPAHQGVMPIANGWEAPRRRFVMEVVVTQPTGSELHYYFNGYTDIDEIINGSLNMNTEFFINSFTVMSRTVGGPYNQVFERIIESAQVINGQIVSSAGNNQLFTMRPTDLFAGIQSNYLKSSYEMNNYGSTFEDRRFMSVGESVRSDRANNMTNAYLARMVDSYRMASDSAVPGQNGSTLLSRSSQMCYEGSLTENPFLIALSHVKGVRGGVSFNLKDLVAIDPDAMSRTTHARLNTNELMKLPRAGQGESWGGQSAATMFAVKLGNALPALMMENFISRATITSNNHSSGGMMYTQVIPISGMTMMDLSRNCEILRRRLETEVFYDLSFNNAGIYSVSIDANLFSELKMTVSFESETLDFVLPTFCDSIYAPVITDDRGLFDNMVTGMELVANRAGSSTATTAASYNIGY